MENKSIIIVSIPYYDLFFDQNFEFIKFIHENDGEYRDEYFNPIFKHFNIEIYRFYINDELDEKIYQKINNGVDFSEIINEIQQLLLKPKTN